MLALILYSGCDCNYDLCREQRDIDDRHWEGSKKWSMFEFSVFEGVRKLHRYDDEYQKSDPIYSGIGKVLLIKDQIEGKKKFSSIVSTSRDVDVAIDFRGDDGGLLFRILPEKVCLLG